MDGECAPTNGRKEAKSKFSGKDYLFKELFQLQQGYFSKYCPNMEIQGNPRTTSQSINRPYS